jgi:hypothetical protein
MKYRFRSNEKAIITAQIPEEEKGQEIRRGMIPGVYVPDYLARRLQEVLSTITPFHRTVLTPAGLISDPVTIAAITIAGFPTQQRILQDNDLFVLVVESMNQTVAAPTGFTEAPNSPVSNAGTNPTRISIFWKRVQIPEAAITVADSGDHQVASLFVIRGAIETGDPFDVTASNSGTGTAITIPGATTTKDNCCVLLIAGSTRNFFSGSTFSAATNADLELIKTRQNFTNDEGTEGGGFALYSAEKTTKGVFGTTSVTQATAVEWTSWVGALKPRSPIIPLLLHPDATGVSGSDPVPNAKTNDIMICFIETNNAAVSITAPSGWASAPNSPVINAGANPTRLTVLWKRATSDAETYPTFSAVADHRRSQIFAVRGCVETASPFDVTNTASGTGGSISIPGFTTTVDNCIVLASVATTRDNAGSNNTFNTWANADLPAMTADFDNTISTGTGGGLGLAHAYKSTAGSIGATTVNQTTAVEWAGWVGALKPKV